MASRNAAPIPNANPTGYNSAPKASPSHSIGSTNPVNIPIGGSPYTSSPMRPPSAYNSTPSQNASGVQGQIATGAKVQAPKPSGYTPTSAKNQGQSPSMAPMQNYPRPPTGKSFGSGTRAPSRQSSFSTQNGGGIKAIVDQASGTANRTPINPPFLMNKPAAPVAYPPRPPYYTPNQTAGRPSSSLGKPPYTKAAAGPSSKPNTPIQTPTRRISVNSANNNNSGTPRIPNRMPPATRSPRAYSTVVEGASFTSTSAKKMAASSQLRNATPPTRNLKYKTSQLQESTTSSQNTTAHSTSNRPQAPSTAAHNAAAPMQARVIHNAPVPQVRNQGNPQMQKSVTGAYGTPAGMQMSREPVGKVDMDERSFPALTTPGSQAMTKNPRVQVAPMTGNPSSTAPRQSFTAPVPHPAPVIRVVQTTPIVNKQTTTVDTTSPAAATEKMPSTASIPPSTASRSSDPSGSKRKRSPSPYNPAKEQKLDPQRQAPQQSADLSSIPSFAAPSSQKSGASTKKRTRTEAKETSTITIPLPPTVVEKSPESDIPHTETTLSSPLSSPRTDGI